MNEPLLTRDEAGARVGKTGYWMVTQARAGKIPHKRVGRDYAWTEAHISEILAMAERRPAPPSTAPKAPAASRKPTGAGSPPPALQANTPRRKRNAA